MIVSVVVIRIILTITAEALRWRNFSRIKIINYNRQVMIIIGRLAFDFVILGPLFYFTYTQRILQNFDILLPFTTTIIVEAVAIVFAIYHTLSQNLF